MGQVKIVPIHTFEPQKMIELATWDKEFRVSNFWRYFFPERIYNIAPPDPFSDAHLLDCLKEYWYEEEKEEGDAFRDDEIHFTPHEEFLFLQEEFLVMQEGLLTPQQYCRYRLKGKKRFYDPVFNLFPGQRLLFDCEKQPYASKAWGLY